MRKEVDQRGWSGFTEAFRTTSNVTTLTALTEDTIVLAGRSIALPGTVRIQVPGNPVDDATAAFVIGRMLLAVALARAWRTNGSSSRSICR